MKCTNRTISTTTCMNSVSVIRCGNSVSNRVKASDFVSKMVEVIELFKLNFEANYIKKLTKINIKFARD